MKRKSDVNSLENYFAFKKKKKDDAVPKPVEATKKIPIDPENLFPLFKKRKVTRKSDAGTKTDEKTSKAICAASFQLVIDEKNPEDASKWKVEYQSCDANSKFENAKFHAVMNMREPNVENTKLHIVCNHQFEDFDLSDLKHNFNRHPVKFQPPSPSLSKSIIQKNVRRGRSACAMRCAMNYLKRDMNGFIRRLGIIVIEDAVLHPYFPILVWLTCAIAKDFKVSKAHLNLLLTIVRDIAKVPRKDFEPEDMGLENMTLHSEICDEFGGSIFVRSLLLRASLGGMKCDVKMLRNFARVWNERFSSADVDWIGEIHRVYETSQRPLVKACKGVLSLKSVDVLVNAVDFHCSSMMNMIKPLVRTQVSQWLEQNGCEDDVEEALMSAVWHFNSKNTTKTPFGPVDDPLPPKKAEVWTVIKGNVRNFQTRFLQTRLGIQNPHIPDG